MHTYITNFQRHNGGKKISQKESTTWLAKYHGEEFYKDFDKYSVDESFINMRKSYVPGIGSYEENDSFLYNINEEVSPSIDKRALFAQKVCEEIFNDFYKNEELPNYLNHISCTHYQSPSAAQKIVVSKDSCEITTVTHLYHMGCYAAFPALRVSKAYVIDGANRVDNVHTEFCSFHLDKSQKSADQIIMKTLFADGAIKYSVVNEDEFQSRYKAGLKILALHEKIVPNSEKEMTWLLGERGFVMGLTKNVPIFIAKKIQTFMEELFQKAGLDYHKDKEHTIFAVHPGGPKIIELVEKMLKLESWQVSHSKEVLYNNGNMSSATVAHIWQNILNDYEVKHKNVVSVAFGPGLTMTGAFLEICKL